MDLVTPFTNDELNNAQFDDADFFVRFRSDRAHNSLVLVRL